MTSYFSKLNPIPQFPEYPGPYTVGSFEVEIPVSSLMDADSPPPPNENVETVQYRIFYPAAKSPDTPEKKDSLENESSGGSSWSEWFGYGNWRNAGKEAEGKSRIDTTRPVRWLPEPHQREYLSAYARFLGASSGFAEIVSHFTRLLHYISLPAVANASLHTPPIGASTFPLMVFSHGLGGTRLAYSYLCCSIASHGVVVVAPEHRDGSGPVTFITTPPQTALSSTPSTTSSSGSDLGKEAEVVGNKPESGEPGIDEASTRAGAEKNMNGSSSPRFQVDYTTYPHQISDETSNGRNRQLEIRLWELSLIYTSLRKISLGDIPTNSMVSADTSPYGIGEAGRSLLEMFGGKLDMEPGRIVWAGHSFGSATMVQFIKSVFYDPPSEIRESEEFKPLFNTEDADLKNQITPESPLMLLDLWCLPLLGKRTSYLFKQPLPQLSPSANKYTNNSRNVLAIMSEEFWKWRENMRGVRRVLSPDPGRKRGGEHWFWFEQWDDAHEALLRNGREKVFHPHLDVVSPTPLRVKEDLSLGGQIVPPTPSISPSPERVEGKEKEPRFYYAMKSAHLSQSDFGVLFPMVVRKALDPERILKLNARAGVQWLREAGFANRVARWGQGEGEGSDCEIWEDSVEGWVRIEVEDRDMTGMEGVELN